MCFWKFLPATSYFQGIIHRWFFPWFPQCASLFTCTQLSTRQNKLHGSRCTLHCKPPAILTLHYTQHYTQHYTRYTTRYTAETLPGAAFRVRTDKLTCISFHSLKASKLQNAASCQQFGSVAFGVASIV